MYITEEQEEKLYQRAQALGFSTKSDYARLVLFMELSVVEKIDQIHKKMCGEDEAA